MCWPSSRSATRQWPSVAARSSASPSARSRRTSATASPSSRTGDPMDIASFAEIEDEFMARVRRIVWCTVATVDRRGRPRTRILHPIWEGSTGWIGTSPRSLKAKHLEHNPYVSLSYWDQQHQQIYADCKAE